MALPTVISDRLTNWAICCTLASRNSLRVLRMMEEEVSRERSQG